MVRFLLLGLGACVLAGCSDGTPPPQGNTAFAPTAAMRQVLAERLVMHAKRPYDVYLDETADIPSAVDAAQAIPNARGLPAPEIETPQVDEVSPAGASGALDGTLYRPKTAKNTPVIIFFPGDTWAYRSDTAADEVSRQLVLRTGYVVLLVRPRLAPDARFPAIQQDAVAAYRWARAQLRGWGADPTRVVLAGEGPGADLALATALAARDGAGVGAPVGMPDQLLLITPWASTATGTASMSENAGAQPLDRRSVRWSQLAYARGHLEDPLMDPAARADLRGLPPTTIVLAQMDPMRSSGQELAARLQASGVRTEARLYPGVTAEFFGLGAYTPEAAQAEADVASALQRNFSMSLVRR